MGAPQRDFAGFNTYVALGSTHGTLKFRVVGFAMWQSRPVFISSTFVDMQAERDYLRTRVFPELEERLRARRYNLEWVDLRVGVATASQRDEHVRELHVLKVCLDEVKRCRPFLIVLLGDRYGWVPPAERIEAAAEEASEGFSSDVAGRSVTDLEIEFGILADPEQQPRSFFYLREPLPYGEMPAETAALYCEDYASDPARLDRKQRLAELKRRIGQHLPSRVRPYAVQWDAAQQRVTGLEAWGRTVQEDIWSELEAETKTSATAVDIPWQRSEHEALEDFIDDRARDFVGRQGILASLTNLVSIAETSSTTWGACVTGDSGSGKSALFGELYHRLSGSGVFLLTHAAGASVNAALVNSMLGRFIGELASALGTDPGLPDDADADTVDAAFARLLGQMAQRRRVVVLIDALDQFEKTTRGRFATWLPRPWPANARLIATAIAGDASKAMAERPGVEALSLPPLDAAEARDIVGGICRRYHRTFEPEVVEALLAKHGPGRPAWANPLWLVLAVEELNLLDADDFARAQRDYTGAPAERLRALMLDTIATYPVDIPGLYAHTFERAEELFGARLARGFLALTAVSRAGWRESDFRTLLPILSGEKWDELRFAQLRRLFRGQMRQRGALAQWEFNHAQMREAVHTQFLTGGKPEKELHELIADHLLSSPPDDPLHITETMHHLLSAKDYNRAGSYYGDPSRTELEVNGATDAVADTIVPTETGAPARTTEICRLLDIPDISVGGSVAQRFLSDLIPTIAARTSVEAMLAIAQEIERAFDRTLRIAPDNSRYQRGKAISLRRIGMSQIKMGNLADAVISLAEGLAIVERLAANDPGEPEWQRTQSDLLQEMAGIYFTLGDLNGAETSFRSSHQISSRLAKSDFGQYGDFYNVIKALNAIGGIYLNGRHDANAALSFFRSSLSMSDTAMNLEKSSTIWRHHSSASLQRIGDVQLNRGDLGDALKSYQQSFTILDGLVKADPTQTEEQRDLAVLWTKIGQVQLAQAHNAKALEACFEGFAILKRLINLDPQNNDLERDLAVSRMRIGDVQLAQDDFTGAIESYNFAITKLERLADSGAAITIRWRDLWVSHMKVSSIHLAGGNLAAASEACQAAFRICNMLTEEAPKHPMWKCDLGSTYRQMGDVFTAQRDFDKALSSYRAMQEIFVRLVESHPENVTLRRELANSHRKIGDVQNAAGDLHAAAESFRASVKVLDTE